MLLITKAGKQRTKQNARKNTKELLHLFPHGNGWTQSFYLFSKKILEFQKFRKRLVDLMK